MPQAPGSALPPGSALLAIHDKLAEMNGRIRGMAILAGSTADAVFGPLPAPPSSVPTASATRAGLVPQVEKFAELLSSMHDSICDLETNVQRFMAL